MTSLAVTLLLAAIMYGCKHLAKDVGATAVISFIELKTIEESVAKVKELTGGFGADFVFQCTGVKIAIVME